MLFILFLLACKVTINLNNNEKTITYLMNFPIIHKSLRFIITL